MHTFCNYADSDKGVVLKDFSEDFMNIPSLKVKILFKNQNEIIGIFAVVIVFSLYRLH